MLNKKISIFLLLFSPVCLPFITTVEYPVGDLKTIKKSKIGINLEGSIFILKQTESGYEWSEDFNYFSALMKWNRILNYHKPEILLDLMLRNSQIPYLNKTIDQFYIMLRFLQNACFFAEMHAWRTVFFHEKKLTPTFFDDPVKGGTQHLQVLLESARWYSFLARFFCYQNIEKRAPALKFKGHLVAFGPVLMLQQAANFYIKYIKNIESQVRKLEQHPERDRLLKSISLTAFDIPCLQNILVEDTQEIGITPAQAQILKSTLNQVESKLGIRKIQMIKQKFAAKSLCTHEEKIQEFAKQRKKSLGIFVRWLISLKKKLEIA